MSFEEFFDNLGAVLGQIKVTDVIDILLVAIIFFIAFRFVQDRRAGRLLIGIALLVVLLFLSVLFKMNALNYLLNTVFSVGLIALLVVFQPELRAALEKMGDRPLRGIKVKHAAIDEATEKCITEVANACENLSHSKTGALIVFERNTKLGEYIMTGTIVDAAPSAMMFGNLFFNKAPLHDGAVVIRDGRIYSAGCFLPLSTNPDIIKELGTRHRAGIGVSENSDAVVVIVSEETGTISVAVDGKLSRNFSRLTLTEELKKLLCSEQSGLLSARGKGRKEGDGNGE